MCLLVFRIQQKVALIQQVFYSQYFVVQFIGIFCLFNKQFIANTSLYTYRSQVLWIKTQPDQNTGHICYEALKMCKCVIIVKNGILFWWYGMLPWLLSLRLLYGHPAMLLKSLLLIWRSVTGELIHLLPIFKTIYNDLNERDKILTRNISELGHSKIKLLLCFHSSKTTE